MWIQLGLVDGLGYEFVVNMNSLCDLCLVIAQFQVEVALEALGANMYGITEVKAPKTLTQEHSSLRSSAQLLSHGWMMATMWFWVWMSTRMFAKDYVILS